MYSVGGTVVGAASVRLWMNASPFPARIQGRAVSTAAAVCCDLCGAKVGGAGAAVNGSARLGSAALSIEACHAVQRLWETFNALAGSPSRWLRRALSSAQPQLPLLRAFFLHRLGSPRSRFVLISNQPAETIASCTTAPQASIVAAIVSTTTSLASIAFTRRTRRSKASRAALRATVAALNAESARLCCSHRSVLCSLTPPLCEWCRPSSRPRFRVSVLCPLSLPALGCSPCRLCPPPLCPVRL